MRRAGASGRLLARFDSGFWNNGLMDLIEVHDGWFSIGVRMQKPIVAAIARIDEDAWLDIDGHIGARPRSPRPSTTAAV